MPSCPDPVAHRGGARPAGGWRGESPTPRLLARLLEPGQRRQSGPWVRVTLAPDARII